MSAFTKLFSVAAKSLARPIINYFAYYNRLKLQDSDHIISKKIRDNLINLGQKFNYYTIKINRKLFKINNNTPINPLCTEKALERGAELVSEIIVYSVLITLPTLEIIRSQIKSKEKENKKIQNLMKMRTDLNKIIFYNYQINKELDDLIHTMKKINESIFEV